MRRLAHLLSTSLLGGAMLVAAVLAAGGTAAAASTATGSDHAHGDAAVHSAAATIAQQAHTLRYWTSERMSDATPLDELVVSPDAVTRKVPAGEPDIVPPSAALAEIVEPQAANSTGAPWTGGGAVTKTAGRVFFTFQGQDASCSGDAVSSDNMSVVVTAGHCVKYQGTWHTNWVFVPGYDHGDDPYGTWTARKLLTTPQWKASEDINYDVGMAVVNTTGGEHLTEAVGGQGIAFNQPRGQQMYAFGYPAADPYDGQRLIYCSGQAFNDPLLSNDQGLSCDMTGGASGGPWFLSFEEGSGTGVQNSVNSFKYRFFSGMMFGPYFGDAAQDLYQRAQSA